MKIQVKDIRRRWPAANVVLTYFSKEKPEAHPLWRGLPMADKRLVQRFFKGREFSGKEGEARALARVGSGKIVLLGLGERPSWRQRQLVLVSRRAVAAAKAERAPYLTLALPPLAVAGVSAERLAQTMAENAVMAEYEFTKYKAKDDSAFAVKGMYVLVGKSDVRAAQRGVKTGVVVGEQVNAARDLGNTPGGEMTPTLLAKKAQEAGREYGFKVKVLGRKEMEASKMGAVLGVAHGSAEEPKFIIMEHRGAPKKSGPPYVFVGKGVTFDTGGLNLKPEKSMLDMHLDMLGGAAVISTLAAAARLKLPVNVIGLVPTVENMPGSAGYRPGDLLKSMSGKTIEVLNTDAEGRIILADALTYAERYQPRLVIDIATLTGACMVALGLKYSGLMTPEVTLQRELVQVGEASGDYVWPLPLNEEFAEEVKGTFGDVANIGKSGYGGASTGAAFLWQFAKKYPWAHLDVAGPMKTVDGQYLGKGASGVGVRFLIELVRGRAQ